MAQDIIADALNMIMNAKKARKEEVAIKRVSKLLIEILKIMKKEGAIKKYKIESKDRVVKVFLGDFVECKVIKPRFTVKKENIEKYRRRFLPSRDVGIIIISTNKGLMTHIEAAKAETGGSLIAYFY